MHKTIARLEELKKNLTLIDFKDYLSDSDYRLKDILKAEIKEVEAQAKGLTGVIVRLSYAPEMLDKYRQGAWYLTSNASLCFSDEPVLFEDQAEAERYVKDAEFNHSHFNIEYVPYTL